MKLLDITGKSRVKLHFSGTPVFPVRTPEAVKLRLRPAGGGSGEDVVALLKKAAVAAGLKDVAGFAGFFDE